MEITQIELAPSPYRFIMNICLVYMNMFARFDEIHSMTLQDIKEICTNKSHQELQREITLKELAPSPYSFIINI